MMREIKQFPITIYRDRHWNTVLYQYDAVCRGIIFYKQLLYRSSRMTSSIDNDHVTRVTFYKLHWCIRIGLPRAYQGRSGPSSGIPLRPL